MKLTTRKYLLPFVLITSLFFLWGFARAILDVLNQHFRDAMNISITESAMIQVTTYLAYFLTAIPAGVFISKYGYRRGVITGLLLYAVGAFLFIPGSQMGTLPAFLVCLLIIGVGLTFLETSANPYATELGPQETATSRLNLSQSFNGMGGMLAPAIIGGFLFTGGSVTIPYTVMGIVVVCVAIIFSFIKLPEITTTEGEQEESHSTLHITHSTFLLGLLALLAYEVSEISINSYFVMFTTGEGYADKILASTLLSLALGIFMGGRFIGAWVMQRIRPVMVLICCAIGSIACMLCVLLSGTVGTSHFTFNTSHFALYALMANFVFESIMFPTIFSLALTGLKGKAKKRASSLLMMTPVGGCAFLLMGLIADSGSLTLPFIIPLIGFCIVLIFAVRRR